MATEYVGSAIVLTWNSTRGSVDMSAETRSVTIDNSVDTIDATAGQDPNRNYLVSFKDPTISWSGVALGAGGTAASAGTAGTLYGTVLEPGVTGTLIAQPLGTVSYAPKYTMSVAVVTSFGHDEPYDDVTTLSAEWKPYAGGSLTLSNNA